ncbi:MAG TPA: LacI family DNA-binding transcriptional regulator [Thermomicrobiales bacterium]|nr:LacI family DNA-binding transcriptional regulator [Thermomicrobiales bacterium]
MFNTSARQRRVTITDIARQLGVTPTTVSNAFNRPDQLSPALRERILDTAMHMGYLGPDAAARSMRRGRLAAIGVLYADRLSNAFADPAFVLFLKGFALMAEGAGLGMTLIPGYPNETREPASVSSAVVDGFVVYSMADDDPFVATALARRLPIVTVDSPHLPKVPFVGIDDEGAARTAAEHLVRLGHRHVGVLSGELTLARRSGPAGPAEQRAATFGVNRARLKGYAAALADAGIDWSAVPVEEVSDILEIEARNTTRRLLARDPRPTALLAMSDRIARAALEVAMELGMRVPEDLSIVGFDDDPEAARATTPLTTVRQPHVDKGKAAARLLIDQLAGRTAEGSQSLPIQLVVRESTAPPRDRH